MVSTGPVTNKRQGGRKSRYGCRNCKLRKVKCDETRPQCLRCRTYGVQCNLSASVGDLQPLTERREQQRPKAPGPRPTITNAIWAGEGSTFFNVDVHDWDLFNKFRHRTLYSMGGSETVDIYENHLLKACLACPFLLHGMLAITAVHDRYLSVAPMRRSLRESYHWSQCTTLFNKWLTQTIKEEDKDPIWATTGSLSVLAFASMNASTTREAWPLGPEDSSDLEWLRLGAGKMSLWHIVDPLRPGSAFRAMMKTLVQMRKPLPEKGTRGVLQDLARLCRLNENSTQASSPYFNVVHSISRLLKIPAEDTTLGDTLMVSNHMHDEFEILLQDKDPVALLLLALWYARARRVIWWIDFRARYELPAICNYLLRYHGANADVQALVPWDEVLPGSQLTLEYTAQS